MGWKFGQKIIDIIRGSQKIAPERSHYFDRHIYTGQDAQDLMYNELQADKPSLICRFGAVELGTVYSFLRSKKKIITFSDYKKYSMENNAGFFPATDYNLSRFSSEFIELCKNIDVLGVWFNVGEDYIAEKYTTSKLVHLEDLNVLNPNHIYLQKSNQEPATKFYTEAFKNKKILVIHPFSKTIEEQYKRRELLFDNSDILPEFELKTIKAIQSISDNKDLPYKNWFEALELMKQQIAQTDFDIAIIGCGAYGIFLADYCKSLGKKAIHLGGVTQLLFGIIGKRWETDYKIKTNKYWVRPSKDDKPKGFEKVEEGCYW